MIKKISLSFIVLLSLIAVRAATKPSYTLTVKSTQKQTITGFGGACCDGAMCPFGNDNECVNKLYGMRSKIGLNILRMEISPNFEGDIKVPEWGNWDSPYDWNGSLPSAKMVKQRGGIVFGTPWSPPGDYKTNDTAQGGNSADQGNQKGKLRKDCYDKFFPWLNSFLDWMHSKGVDVDAVSIQNEPDWWVSYSGCLYEPEDQVDLVKNYVYMLDRDSHKNVKLISAEPLGYRKDYFDALLNDQTCREQVDIFAGHIYGHMPLQYIKPVANAALPYGKEIWMTEHSVTDNIDHLPTWKENLIFAEELNECMLAGCTGYIYWYLRAHWSFTGTGETKYGTENKKDELLPRAYVMSHFSKNVTGSTRLETSKDGTTGRTKEELLANFEHSAYIKGDSLIVMNINATGNAKAMLIELPYNVKSGELWLSTGNEADKRCQKSELDITESTNEFITELPAQSLSTYIFMIDKGSTAIENVHQTDNNDSKTYYDLHGHRLDTPHGLCIERSANGQSRKVIM